MPFPSSERVIFAKNPLVQVVCQLRFPTILAISTEAVAGFQDRVRQDYPFYQRDLPPGLPKEVSALLAQAGAPVLGEGGAHQFSSLDRKRMIGLSQDWVAVTESNYEQWETFRQEIDRAVTAVRETFRPAIYTRVGLRYQDLIDRTNIGIDDVPWDRLISPYFLGLLGSPDIGEDIREIQSLTLVALDGDPSGFVTIRHGLVEVSSPRRSAYLIDADFYTEEQCDHDRAFRALDRFHLLSANLFRWAITPELTDALGPAPIR